MKYVVGIGGADQGTARVWISILNAATGFKSLRARAGRNNDRQLMFDNEIEWVTRLKMLSRSAVRRSCEAQDFKHV